MRLGARLLDGFLRRPRLRLGVMCATCLCYVVVAISYDLLVGIGFWSNIVFNIVGITLMLFSLGILMSNKAVISLCEFNFALKCARKRVEEKRSHK